jgi:hypothetical protein
VEKDRLKAKGCRQKVKKKGNLIEIKICSINPVI